jgi:uncharacterized protein (TIGR00369 family)
MTKVGRETMSSDAPVTNRLDAARIEELIDKRFPQIHSGGRTLVIEETGERSARVRLRHHERHMRPGGTVAGTAMFTLADFAVYVAIIATLGEVGLSAVTTNLNINFLAKPEPRDMIADVRLIRLGRRLAVAEVEMRSEGMSDLVAHAIATYALPTRDRQSQRAC